MPKPKTSPVSEMVTKRKQLVVALARSGKTLPQIVSELHDKGVVNPRTGKGYSRQTIKSDMALARQRRPVSETIGQWTYVRPLWQSRILLHVDTTYKDYVFWDALRRGTAPGYEIGGLFCSPIAQTIASHVLGDGITATLLETPSSPKTMSIHEDGKPTKNLKTAGSKPSSNGNGSKPSPNGNGQKPTMPKARTLNSSAGDPVAYTNAQLKRMMERMQSFLLQVVVDNYCFGNQYVIVNPDCTFSVASPETVTVEYSASDYRRPIRYIIRTKMEKARVEDVYTEDKRILTIRFYDDRGTQTYEYENLIGRIPIIHFANDRSANEIYGRPIYEAALPIMQRYDDLIYNTVEGVKLLANPIPTFEGLDNPTETKLLNSDAIPYEDADGNPQIEYRTRFDRNAGLYLGKGGSAKMLAPPVGFTKDELDTLRQLFLLLLNHTRIPEFVWGGAIASSKASAEAQKPPFIQYIKFRRLMLEGEGADPALSIEARGGLLELIDVWLRTYKLLNPSIVIGPVKIVWPALNIQDDQLKYQWGTYLDATGRITAEDTIALSGFWDDPAAVAARAVGKDQRPPQFDDFDAKLRQAKLEQARASMAPPDDANGPAYSTDWVTPEFEHPEEAPIQIAGPLYVPGLAGGPVG